MLCRLPDRIETSRMEWMTAQQPPDSQAESAEHPVLLNRLYRVF